MRNYLILVSLFIVGCSSTPHYEMYDKNEDSDTKPAIVFSEYNKNTEKLILKQFEGYRFTRNIFGGITEISETGVKEVNGISDKSSGWNKYNDIWSGAYRIVLNSGENSFLVDPFSDGIQHPIPVNKIKVDLLPGHKYFLGQILDIDEWTYTYKWQALLVDETDNKVIYPVLIK